MKKAGKFDFSIATFSKKAFRIAQGLPNQFGLIVGGILGSCTRSSHNFRLLIDGDEEKYICGNCGKFIYKRNKNWYDSKVWLDNFLSKECLGCSIIEANKKKISLDEKIIKDGLLGDKVESERVNIKYNHSLRCYLSQFFSGVKKYHNFK